MPRWLIIAEETVTENGVVTHRQVTVVRPVSGNKSREQALVDLYTAARSHVPESLRSTTRVTGRDGDGSFWVLPKNAKGKTRASCNIRLIEQVRP
ncbi:hypothetical protein ACFXA3_10490 [Streptomyces sp. NPDC059456]|uniref:hypothetical protein n=1 Tax=Streptomyces sp. NPDC059456 TaxID=3346838 RepID=UPI003678A5EC